MNVHDKLEKAEQEVRLLSYAKIERIILARTHFCVTIDTSHAPQEGVLWIAQMISFEQKKRQH